MFNVQSVVKLEKQAVDFFFNSNIAMTKSATESLDTFILSFRNRISIVALC